MNEVSFWHRKIGPGELAAVIRARESRLPSPTTRPGLEEEMRAALQADATARSTRLPVRSEVGRVRAEVMGAIDAKLGHILEHVHAEMAPASATPVRLLASGEGLTFWPDRTDLAVGDLLEVRLPLFPGSPIPMHGYCRVRRLRREWSWNGVRVDCAFETMEALEHAATPPAVAEPVEVPVPASPSEALEIFPPEPSIWDEPEVILSEEPVKNEPVFIDTSPSPSGNADQTLENARRILEAPVHEMVGALASHVRPDRRSPGPRRQDYRVNDEFPIAWIVIGEPVFERAAQYFQQHREFPARERIARQRKLQAEVDGLVAFLRKMYAASRRTADWLRDHLDQLFRQANSENEEEFLQHLTLLYSAILREFIQRSPGGPAAAQLLAHMRAYLELKETRGRQVTEEKADADMAEISRQATKMLGELRGVNRAMADKLAAMHEALMALDLSTHDVPRRWTAAGDAVHAGNLSATGLAWRTSKTWVAKGDAVEVRMVLSRDGKLFEPVISYARVVVVQEPDEQNKRRIACFFEHMSPHHREMVLGHIARKQREELQRRAGL
ncbi:MAG: hypothetical protein HQM03_08490 [Magnetococcales bacterium]|nr:hypothetical protein [Magnetococcales bacterium]